MLSKQTINILYVVGICFVLYMIISKAKQKKGDKPQQDIKTEVKLDKKPFNEYTDDELLSVIQQADISSEKIEVFSEIKNQPDFMKRRIEELKLDLQDGQKAIEILKSRGVFV